MNENALKFKSSLTMEEIGDNFSNIDYYERLMEALYESLAYERAPSDSKTPVENGAEPNDNT
jgi:hypothetical protein